jgi:hypothetical protein
LKRFPILTSSTVGKILFEIMAEENDEFSYAYLRNMWAQKEKVASPLQMQKPKGPKISFKSSNSQKRPAKNIPRTLDPIDVPDETKTLDDDNVISKSKELIDDDMATTIVSTSQETSSPSNDISSAEHSSSFQDDITDNLMKLNENGFRDIKEDADAGIQTYSHEEVIAPTRLWDEIEESCSLEQNASWDKGDSYSSNLDSEVWSRDKVPREYDPEQRMMRQPSSKKRSSRLDEKDQSSAPNESRDSISTTFASRDLYDNFDPYDNYESFTVNSEETVKVQNKEVTESREEKKDQPSFPIFDGLCHEDESIIPDSAFESMAARIASNIAGSSNTNSTKSVGLRSDTQNVKSSSFKASFEMDETNLESNYEHHINTYFSPNRGMSSAESDVFDGLSDIGSMINAFGLLTPDFDQTHSLQKNQETKTSFPEELPSKTRYPKERPSTVFPNRIPEKSQDAKRRFVENLASFAKKDTTRKKQIKLMGQQTLQCKTDSISSLAPVKEDANDETCDEISSSAVETSDCSLGFSTWNQGKQIKPCQNETSTMHPTRSEPIAPHREENSVHHSDHNFNQHAPNLLANVTWIPSMIRLYKLQSVTSTKKKPIQPIEFTQSPNSVVDINMADNITYSDLILEGFNSIQLHRYEIFGGRIADPTSLLRNYPFDLNESVHVQNKLESYKKSVCDNKRFYLRKKRTKMLDKAVEVHLNGMLSIQMKRFEDAAGIYESFFECYSQREFEAEDVKQEKQLISVFLFNLGIIYAHMDEFSPSLDFLNESLITLAGHEISSEDVAVSYYMHYALRDHSRS